MQILGWLFFLYLTVRGNEIQRFEKLLEGGFEWEYGGIGELLRKRKRKDILSRENSRADVKEKKLGSCQEDLAMGYMIDGRGRTEEGCTERQLGIRSGGACNAKLKGVASLNQW